MWSSRSRNALELFGFSAKPTPTPFIGNAHLNSTMVPTQATNAASNPSLLMKLILKLLCVMTTSLALAAGAGAQTFTVLKTFNANINATGFHAWGTLAEGPDGMLYGVTTDGGAGGAGVLFRIQTNGTAFTVIKSFPLVSVTTGTNADGATPHAGLILSGGTLFGTTSKGGSGGSGRVTAASATPL